MAGESQRPPDHNIGGPTSDVIPALKAGPRRVLQAIVTRILDGRTATIQSICDDLELSSTGGVAQHRDKLIELEILKRTPHKAGIELETAWKDPKRLAALGIHVGQRTARHENRTPMKASSKAGFEQLSFVLIDMPIVGSSAAGQPLLVQPTGWKDNVEQIVRLPNGVVGNADYLVQIKGDSMIGVGILDGDVVFVREQDTARSGEIVLAVLPGEEPEGRITIKRLVRRRGRVFLEPANPNEETIPGDQALVRGKVVGVMHWFESAPWSHRILGRGATS